jgi:hypothetical protein
MRDRHPTLHTKDPADGEPDEGFGLRLKEPPFRQTPADLPGLQAELQAIARTREPETSKAGRRRPR